MIDADLGVLPEWMAGQEDADRNDILFERRLREDTEADKEPQIHTIKCVSANVQRSHENTTQLLERYRDHDVICVQEIYWGRIKQVVSTSSKKGDLYEETVSH